MLLPAKMAGMFWPFRLLPPQLTALRVPGERLYVARGSHRRR